MSQIVGEPMSAMLFPPEQIVKCLVEGILLLHQISLSDCPFESTLRVKLARANKKIRVGQFDSNDWEETTLFLTPEALYDYLIGHMPSEDLVFTHGDYCFEKYNFTGW